jgi:hypothetical protein
VLVERVRLVALVESLVVVEHSVRSVVQAVQERRVRSATLVESLGSTQQVL